MCSMASVESIAGQVVADHIYCDKRDWDWDLFPTASGLQSQGPILLPMLTV